LKHPVYCETFQNGIFEAILFSFRMWLDSQWKVVPRRTNVILSKYFRHSDISQRIKKCVSVYADRHPNCIYICCSCWTRKWSKCTGVRGLKPLK